MRLTKEQKADVMEEALRMLKFAEELDSQKIADEAFELLKSVGIDWLDVIEYQGEKESK